MDFIHRKKAEAKDIQSMIELTSGHFRYVGRLQPLHCDPAVQVPITEEQREYLTYKKDLRFYLSSGSFDLSYLKRKYERYINEWTKPLIAKGQAAYCPIRIRQQATKDVIEEIECEKECNMEEIFAEMDRITEKFYNEIDRLTEKLQPKQEPYMQMSVKIPNVLKDQREYLDSALGTYEQDKLEQEIAYYRRAVQRGAVTVDELKAMYAVRESHRIEWKESGSKNYRDFCRRQEALEFIIAEMNHQKGKQQ